MLASVESRWYPSTAFVKLYNIQEQAGKHSSIKHYRVRIDTLYRQPETSVEVHTAVSRCRRVS